MSKKKKKFTQEELTQKLLASREKIEKNREELQKRGYTPKDIQIIKFMQKPTLLRAVKMQCWECQGFSWAEAKACKNKRCALHPFVFRGRGNKKDLFTYYRDFIIEAGELNPDLDCNIDFSNLFEDGEEDEAQD